MDLASRLDRFCALLSLLFIRPFFLERPLFDNARAKANGLTLGLPGDFQTVFSCSK
jgi:hypothetical protein